MTDKLQELQNKFYQMFDDLNEARPVFKGIDEAFLCFAQNILGEYKSEYARLKKEEEIEEQREIYKLQCKAHTLIPRRRRNWRRFFRREPNLAMQILDEEIERDTQHFFSDCLQRLSERDEGEQEEAPENASASDSTEGSAEDLSTDQAQEIPPMTIAKPQQLITVYVAGYIPPSAIELEEDEEQPTNAAAGNEDFEDNSNGDVETEVEDFGDYGIDTDYEIVDDDADETPGEMEEPADLPENGLVTGEEGEPVQTPDENAGEPAEGDSPEENDKEGSND